MQAVISNVLKINSKVTLLAVTVVMLASVFLASKTYAANVNSSSIKASSATTTSAQSATKNNKIFSIQASLTQESNMYDQQDYNRVDNTSLLINLGAKIADKSTLTLTTSFVKEYSAAEAFTMENTTLGLTHKTLQINPDLSWNNRIFAVAPTSRYSQLNDSLRGSAGLSTILNLNNNNTILPFNISGALTLQSNFHEYNLNADGTPNTQYSLGQSLTIGLNFTDSIALTFSGLYKTSYNYENRKKYGFNTSADLSYAINDHWGVSTGISNGGNALKANGVDSNISLIDQKTSTINAALNMNY